MTKRVMLSIQGRQCYADQEPDLIELVTEGEMAPVNGGWEIRYQESDLTGLEGVLTTFRVEPEKVTLTRSGALKSQMEFQVGKSHDSLYQMPFGALMMTVCTRSLFFDILPEGGSIDIVYDIAIEHSETGTVEYHLDIRTIGETK